MSTLFEPSPILLAFLALKTTFYLPALLILALLRTLLLASGVMTGTRWRWIDLLHLLLLLAGLLGLWLVSA